MTEYIKVDWETEGPTQGIATLVGALTREGRMFDGHPIIDCGQGAELPLTDQEMIDFLSEGTNVQFKGIYNTSPGGSPDVREATARFVSDFYRIPATAKNTFLIHGLGRACVKLAFEQAAHTCPYNTMSDLGWKTLNDLSNDMHQRVVGFDHTKNLPNSLSEVFENNRPKNCGTVLINRPSNPTSEIITAEEFNAGLSVIDDTNRQPNTKIKVLLDAPYGYLAPSTTDAKGRYLMTGMEGVLQNHANLSYAVVLSCSKFLATANMGGAILVVSDDQVKAYEKALSIGGLGLARNDVFFSNMAHFLGGENDELIWRRLDQLGIKYLKNRILLEETFPNEVFPGIPGMLALLRIKSKDLLGKEVHCCDGQKRVLKNGNDIIEYLANVHGVGVVSNGFDADSNMLIRLALREEPENFALGVKALAKGLETIRNSPKPGLHISAPTGVVYESRIPSP